MPRSSRLDAQGVLHHVIGRGIKRKEIFIDNKDRANFITRLAALADNESMDIYAFALLPNHVLCGAPHTHEMKKNLGSNDKDRMLTVQSHLLLFRTEDGRTRVEVRLQDETVWMTQATMAELYQTTPQNISLHLKAMYQEGELDPQATCKEFLQVQSEGLRQLSRNRKFYNLPANTAVSKSSARFEREVEKNEQLRGLVRALMSNLKT